MSEREAAERLVLDELDALGVDYETMECDPELADTAAFCAHYGVPLEASCNLIIVASKKGPAKYCACLVTATSRLDVNKRVRGLMEVKKVSFASAEVTRELTGQMIGGVSVFGLPDSMAIYIDARCMELDWAVVGGGSRSMKIKCKPEAFAKLERARVIEDLAKPRPEPSAS